MSDTITKQEPKLSVRKPGHWRNLYLYPVPYTIVGGDTVPAGENYGWGRWPSKEIAEEKGAEWMRQLTPRGRARGHRYLGPVFFPEGDDA